MKKNIAICAAAILMAGSLWACGSGTAGASSGSDAGAAEQNTQSDGAAEQNTQSDGAQTEAEQNGSEDSSQAGQDGSEDSAQAQGAQSASSQENGRISIVTTIFPEYDWVMNLLGDNPAQAEVTMLLDNGVDLHSYQPTAEDILKISDCDMFIYVGGESDDWVEDALKEAVNEDMVVINLLDVLGSSVKEEEIVEGMEHDHDHDEADHDEADHDEADHDEADHDEDDHDESDHDHEHEEVEYDEHVWLSLKSSQTLCKRIGEGLATVDPANAAVYQQNTESYVGKLDALDKRYEEVVAAGKVKTLLFGDRFPFRYMTDDYGLEYFAAFAGCSAETEASFETVTFLAQKVDELGLHNVMTIEGTDHRIAETIVQSTKTRDQNILTLDSMQATTSEDVAGGASYLSIMENNLTVLEEALQND